MKTIISALCGLMLALAPLAFAQTDSQKKGTQSPYRTKAEAEKHKADIQSLANCSAEGRRRKLAEGSADWGKHMAACQRR